MKCFCIRLHIVRSLKMCKRMLIFLEEVMHTAKRLINYFTAAEIALWSGSALMIIFSLFYGYISYTFSYFGEMITYLGMTAPMALFAFIS